LGRQQQHARRHSSVLGALLRRKGRHGLPGGQLCRRVGAVRHRNLDHHPGAFTSGTNHFVHAGKPEDEKTLAAYETGPNATLGKEIMDGFARTAPPDADVSAVAEAVVHVVDLPFGKRPFRVHIDPANDGAEVVNGVADRVRTELLRNLGLADLLKPAAAVSARTVLTSGGIREALKQ
jgi:hypothetical protein